MKSFPARFSYEYINKSALARRARGGVGWGGGGGGGRDKLFRQIPEFFVLTANVPT